MKHDYRDEQGNKLDPTTGCTLPEPEATSVSWESIFGRDAVQSEAFEDSTQEWHRQDLEDREERARLIREIEQRKLREAL